MHVGAGAAGKEEEGILPAGIVIVCYGRSVRVHATMAVKILEGHHVCLTACWQAHIRSGAETNTWSAVAVETDGAWRWPEARHVSRQKIEQQCPAPARITPHACCLCSESHPVWAEPGGRHRHQNSRANRAGEQLGTVPKQPCVKVALRPVRLSLHQQGWHIEVPTRLSVALETMFVEHDARQIEQRQAELPRSVGLRLLPLPAMP